jgi:hypothetical protein
MINGNVKNVLLKPCITRYKLGIGKQLIPVPQEDSHRFNSEINSKKGKRFIKKYLEYVKKKKKKFGTH